MTRRSLLLSAAALAGMGGVAKATAPADLPLGSWIQNGLVPTSWTIEAFGPSGDRCTWTGLTCESYDKARSRALSFFPLSEGCRHHEKIMFRR